MADNKTTSPTEAFNAAKVIRNVACVIAATASGLSSYHEGSSAGQQFAPSGNVNLTAGHLYNLDTVSAAIRHDQDRAEVTVRVSRHDFSFMDPNRSHSASVDFTVDKSGKAGAINPDTVYTTNAHTSGSAPDPKIDTKMAQDLALAKGVAEKAIDAINTGSCERPAAKFKGYNPQ